MSRSAPVHTLCRVFTSWCGVIGGLWIASFCYCGQRNKSFLTPCSGSPSRAAGGRVPRSSRCSDPCRSKTTHHCAVPGHREHALGPLTRIPANVRYSANTGGIINIVFVSVEHLKCTLQPNNTGLKKILCSNNDFCAALYINELWLKWRINQEFN